MEEFDFGAPDEAAAVDQAGADPLPTYIQSKRGSERVSHNGYLYGSPKALADDITVAWRCVYKLQCNARLHTIGRDGAVVREVGDHAHLGDATKVEAEKLKTVVKRRASDTVEVLKKLQMLKFIICLDTAADSRACA